MSYIDGFLLPLPKKNIKAYRTMAQKAGKIWREHGALVFKECIGDDLKKAEGVSSFVKGVKAKKGETVLFSFIIFKSKARRDSVNKKVMKDPRISKLCDSRNMPFDCKRMFYGGFKELVSL